MVNGRQRIRDLVREANAAEASGDWQAALTLLRQAQDLAPHHQGLVAFMVRILLVRGDVQEASGLAESLVAADPASVPGLIALASCQRHRGQLPEAIASYERAAAIDPSHPGVKAALVTLGRRSVADSAYDQEAVRALIDKAEESFGEQDPATALANFRQALALHPGNPDLLAASSRCHRRLGQVDQAEALLQQCLQEHPNQFSILLGLAELEADRGHWWVAGDWYARARAANPAAPGLEEATNHSREAAAALPRRLMLVLGMHATGSSATAGLLCGHGFQAPLPAHTTPASDSDPRGHWQPNPVVSAHDALLEEQGLGWANSFLPTAAWDAELLPRHGEAIGEALRRAFDNDRFAEGILLVKDPRQCRLQLIWNRLLDQHGLEAAVVLQQRHPLAVARSLLQRGRMPANRSLLLWLQHSLAAERHTRHLPRLLVDYDQVLAEPGAVLARCQALWPHHHFDGPGASAEADFIPPIDPTLNHAGADPAAAMAELGPVDSGVLELALAVHGALLGPEECRSDQLEKAWCRLEDYMQGLDSTGTPTSKRQGLDDLDSAVDFSNRKNAKSENLESLISLVESEMQRLCVDFLVLSVHAGTIMVASYRPPSTRSQLLCEGMVTHILASEQLVHRDPVSLIRISCLRMMPLRPALLREREHTDFTLTYGDFHHPLEEHMPELNQNLRIQLENWDGNSLCGWIGIEKDFLLRVPNLALSLNHKGVRTFAPSIDRFDVLFALETTQEVPCGFILPNLKEYSSEQGCVCEIRDAITYKLISSCYLPRSASVFNILPNLPPTGFNLKISSNNDGTICSTATPSQGNMVPITVFPQRKIDILVPIYKNWSLTKACLEAIHESVQISKDNYGVEIYIHATNDCSPEPEVNEMLPKFCDKLGIFYHSNRTNLGFIGTVNNFFMNTQGDVLLINSDVLVGKNLISQLLCATKIQDPTIASITAFSNNATIYSYPYQCVENSISSEESIDRIAEAFQVASAEMAATNGGSELVRVPVSHGFLMYMTRTALSKVGFFDDCFGLGYGEEVDWAMRATQLGFRHFVCASAYAFHKGSVSFGSKTREKAVSNSHTIILERYPYYDSMVHDYISVDYHRKTRNRVAQYLLTQSDKPFILHVTHSSGGGINKYISDYASHHPGSHHLRLTPGRSYHDLLNNSCVDRMFTLECEELEAAVQGFFADDILSSLTQLALGSPIHLILHSFVGWHIEEIERLLSWIEDYKITYEFIAHDYMTVCPRVKLINSSGDYCGLAEESTCRYCLSTSNSSAETSLLAPLTSDISLYRSFFHDILAGAKKIICSTTSQADLLSKLDFKNIAIAEPSEPLFSRLPSVQKGINSGNLVVIGGISEEKGAERLFQVAGILKHLKPNIHIYLIGDASNMLKLKSLDNFTHTGGYSCFNELTHHVLSIHEPIAFFPAIWPETWCYTLSEAMAMQLPVIAPRLGAIGDRLLKQEQLNGLLYDHGISDLGLAELISSFIK